MPVVSLAPMQGYTEFPVRNSFNKIIGGVNKYYTPYLRIENDKSIRKKHLNDILPKNNQNIELIPQVLVNNIEDFKQLHTIIKQYGYNEINLNLGCPFPMVTNKKLGSGLLNSPKLLNSFFEDIFAIAEVKISVKFRSGLQSNKDIFQLIDIFNRFPFHELIFHPRTGKQLYKGSADVSLFNEINSQTNLNLAYNGDITDLETFNAMSKHNKSTHFMIGRGLLKNIFLAKEIKDNLPICNKKKFDMLCKFHQNIFNHYLKSLCGDAHVLNKMTHLWEYLSQMFDNQNKIYKSIKKCKNLRNYELLINELNYQQLK